MKKEFKHPYIPNTSSYTRKKMLEYLGLKDIEDLINKIIPTNLRFKGKLNLPDPLISEVDLKKYINNIIFKNQSCEDLLCFLGGDIWQHYVPSICDEIGMRDEFLTAYTGSPAQAYTDHGRFQAQFEYQSLMAELLDMDVVTMPSWSWGNSAATALRIASRITKRKKVLVINSISPERFNVINQYLYPDLKILKIKIDKNTGMVDLNYLKKVLTDEIAAIYIENPSYYGVIELNGKEISEISHSNNSLLIVGVDPISLGYFKPPSQYGADIVVGTLQPLGLHMNLGGGIAGFLATKNDPNFIQEIPYRITGMVDTLEYDEFGFEEAFYERTSFMVRESPDKSKEFFGTAAGLWAIIAGVYLSLMGPKGMYEIGETILKKTQYAIDKLSEIDGISVPKFKSIHFKNFIIDFSKIKLNIDEINRRLLKYGIIGGLNISDRFKNNALYSVTEIHSKENIDFLKETLKKIINENKR